MTSKNLGHGPVFGLSIMALFAVMVPVFYLSNNTSSAKSSHAASPIRFTVPSNEPRFLLDDKSPTPRPTNKPGRMMPNGYGY